MEYIPVIDISEIGLTLESPSVEGYKKVSKSLATALSTWGFAYIANHGVDSKIVSTCFKESAKFFELAPVIKQKYS